MVITSIFHFRIAFFRLQDYDIAVKQIRKVSTFLCYSYLKETIERKEVVLWEKNYRLVR